MTKDSPKRRAAARRSAAPKAKGQTGKRLAKRDAVLDEAAAQFNARGIAAVSLNDIAETLGLTRAALYYYVDDRDDLVFESYMRACAVAADDLEAAHEAAKTGLERVLAYMSRALDPERPPSAVLAEIAYLAEPQRGLVEKAHRRNVEALKGFVLAGQRDGSLRACDAEIAIQTVIGILSWIPLSQAWIGGTDGSPLAFRKKALAAALDLTRNGIASDPGVTIDCPVNAESFVRRPANVFDRREAAAMKVEQLLTAACTLFNRKGIDGTSLDDVTAALGATKGALYHYIADKDELVALCYRRSFDLHDKFVETAEEHGKTGLARGMIGTHLNAQALAGALQPLMPGLGVDALPAAERREFTARARKLQRNFERFGREGIADGSYRRFDIGTVALIGAGTFGWLPKWLPEGHTRAPRRIADEITRFFAAGLAQR